jgi:hypothetical protein
MGTIDWNTWNNDKCISKELLGIQHPYAYCVKPSDEMVHSNFTKGGLSMKNTKKVLGGLFDYIEYLTIDADSGTKNICKTRQGKGIIGNKYILRTNIKCKAIDYYGNTISGEHYLDKYINNSTTIGGLITGGTPVDDVNGLIPSTFASAGKIGGNVLDIVGAFSGDTTPYCMPVFMQCHVIDSKNSFNNYKGFSPIAWLSLDDIRNTDESLFGFFKPLIPDIKKEVEAPVEPEQPLAKTAPESAPATKTAPETAPATKTAPESAPEAAPLAEAETVDAFTNIIDNIIYQNTDKIQSVTPVENAINQINFQDEFLIKIYYVGFSILLIIIIFKLINKKY